MATKTILIKAVIEGSGIVNFDSNDQKSLWNQQENVERVRHDNISFGKGRYYSVVKDVNNEQKTYLVKVPIISADCLRHAMYEESMFIHLPNIMHNDDVLLSAVATPAFIERGYLFARKDKTIWKRTSPFKLSYAKAVSSSVSSLETFANTQPKNAIKKSEDAAETSFFKREVRGDTTYEVTGAIDLRELGFLSLSEVHDRPCVDADYANRFREKLGARLKSEVPQAGYYTKDHDVYEIPEFGVLLTEAQVKFLAQDILRRLACFSVTRTVTGHARTVSVEVKFVDDPLQDLPSDPEGWVKIFSGGIFNASALDSVVLDRGYTWVEITDQAEEKIKGYREKYGAEQKKATKDKPVKKKPEVETAENPDSDDNSADDDDDDDDDDNSSDSGSSGGGGGGSVNPADVLAQISSTPKTVGEICKALGASDTKPVSSTLNMLIVTGQIKTEGAKRGKRYFL